MPKRIRKSDPSGAHRYRGRHRFEHWYVSNQVYFISARCRGRYRAFASEQAKAVFWDRFEHHTAGHAFVPWVTSLIDNHYHVLGYCKTGSGLGAMMQRLHGSVAKLVNDLLPARRLPFWTERGAGHADYFDGCIRDEKQCRLTYRYVLTQSVRHGICKDWREYPHTHVNIDLDRALRRAIQLNAFLRDVPYQRYEKNRRRRSD